MSKVALTEQSVHIGWAHLEADGIIGEHEAVVPQLFIVINGEAIVSGKEGEQVWIEAGEAVFWEKGERHEAKTATGLQALIVESEGLNPSDWLESFI